MAGHYRTSITTVQKRGNVRSHKHLSLTSVYFRRLPLPDRSGEILDIGVIPVAFTGRKPAMKYIFDQREA